MRVIRIAAGLLFLAVTAFAQTNEPWSGTYQYDGAGNVKAIGQNHYVYDGVSRLRQGTAITVAQQAVQQYSYDAFGNLLSITVAGDTAQTLNNAVDHATNRVSYPDGCPQGGTCYLGAYDEAGNQVTFGSTTYAYDSENMAVNLHAPARNQYYIYDAAGQRVATVDYGGPGNATWHYTLRDDASQVLREVDDVVSGTSHAYAWKKDYARAGTRLLSVIKSGSASETVLHLHTDHLGTPRLITGVNGLRVAAHTYLPFGREALGSDADDEALKFTGHERDSSGDGNDLDYMHARYYSNTAGRFLSIDPVLSVDRTRSRPQAWNRYAYVLNQPLRLTDPSGQYEVDCTGLSARDTRRCNDAAKRFEAQRQNNLKSKSEDVRRTAMAWGEAGKHDGVVIAFRSQGQVNKDAGETQNDVPAFVNPYGSKDGVVDIKAEFVYSMSDRKMAQAVAHEGSHVEDDRGFIESFNPLTGKYSTYENFSHYDTEWKAYDIGSQVMPYPDFKPGPQGYPELGRFIHENYGAAHFLVFEQKQFPQE